MGVRWKDTFEEREREVMRFAKMNPIFAELTHDELKKLTTYIFKIDVRKGLPVFREGDIGDSMYFVVSGELGVYKRTPADKYDDYGRKIASIRSGQSFGEIALFDSYTRTATVVAETDCTLLKLPRKELERLEREEKGIAFKILKKIAQILSSRLRQTTDMLADFLTLKG